MYRLLLILGVCRGRRQSVDHPTVYQNTTGVHISDDTERSEGESIAFDPWQAFPLSAGEERISNFEPFKTSPSSVRHSEMNDGTREVDLIASRHDLGTLQCAAAKALCSAAVRRYCSRLLVLTTCSSRPSPSWLVMFPLTWPRQ